MEEMKDKQIVQQIIDHSLAGIPDDPWLAQRVLSNVKRKEEIVVKKKTSVSVVLVVIMVLLMTGTALAAAFLPNLLQLLNLQDNPAAANMIEAVSYSIDTEYATAKVREMMYDGHGVYVLMDVEPKSKSCVIIPPGKGISLKDKAGSIGLVDCKPEETIAEYASRKNWPVVYFSCAVQNEERSFQTNGIPNELVINEDGSWTQALRFPAGADNALIKVRLYTTVYDDPVVQAELKPGDPMRPLSEPKSITIPVSAMSRIEPKNSDEAVVTGENFLPDSISIRQVNVYHTDIAHYLDIVFDNPLGEEYNLLVASIQTQQLLSDNISFTWPNDSLAGYASGFRYVMMVTVDEDFPNEFDVTVMGEQQGSRKNLGTAHIKIK